MARDETLSLKDVQVILGHAHLSTTADVSLIEDEVQVIRRVQRHLADRDVVDLGEHPTIKEAIRFGQRPTTELVDAYNIECKPIRDLLVRYLDERRPGLD